MLCISCYFFYARNTSFFFPFPTCTLLSYHASRIRRVCNGSGGPTTHHDTTSGGGHPSSPPLAVSRRSPSSRHSDPVPDRRGPPLPSCLLHARWDRAEVQRRPAPYQREGVRLLHDGRSITTGPRCRQPTPIAVVSTAECHCKVGVSLFV